MSKTIPYSLGKKVYYPMVGISKKENSLLDELVDLLINMGNKGDELVEYKLTYHVEGKKQKTYMDKLMKNKAFCKEFGKEYKSISKVEERLKKVEKLVERKICEVK